MKIVTFFNEFSYREIYLRMEAYIAPVVTRDKSRMDFIISFRHLLEIENMI